MSYRFIKWELRNYTYVKSQNPFLQGPLIPEIRSIMTGKVTIGQTVQHSNLPAYDYLISRISKVSHTDINRKAVVFSIVLVTETEKKSLQLYYHVISNHKNKPSIYTIVHTSINAVHVSTINSFLRQWQRWPVGFCLGNLNPELRVYKRMVHSANLLLLDMENLLAVDINIPRIICIHNHIPCFLKFTPQHENSRALSFFSVLTNHNFQMYGSQEF